MTNTWARIIFLVEMDVGAYTGHFPLLFPWPPMRHRGTRDRVATPFLSLPIILMTARPSAPQNSPHGVFCPVSSCSARCSGILAQRIFRAWRSDLMIRVFVEVREGADLLRVEVRAESISQAVGSIE
jgi:hypothetical protein